MLNRVWLGLVLAAVLTAGFGGRMQQTVDAIVDSAQKAVTLAISLIGIMTLWLGMMRLADKAGLVAILAKALRPILSRLFPQIPQDHPALGSIMMNLTANMLGLSNAATPLGLKAMQDLQALNPRPDTASDSMCTFLALNTGSLQLIPATAVALLAGAGAVNPTAIVGTTLASTACAATAGLIVAKTAARWRWFRLQDAAPPTPTVSKLDQTTAPPASVGANVSVAQRFILGLYILCFLLFVTQLVWPAAWGRLPRPDAASAVWIRLINAISLVSIPFLIGLFPLFATLRKISVYEEFTEGAKEGFHTAVRIMPFLVAMLVAIGALRGSGCMEMLTDSVRRPLAAIGFPSELLPLALLRPLTGSGSLAAFGDLIKAHGPDSLLARTAGTLYGSTETTFYVLAVYFGSVGIRRTRHALLAGLAADLTGCLAAVYICRAVFS
jgi:spore maturation protein SpmA